MTSLKMRGRGESPPLPCTSATVRFPVPEKSTGIINPRQDGESFVWRINSRSSIYNSSISGYQTRELEISLELYFPSLQSWFTRRALKMFPRQYSWPSSLSCHKSICYLDLQVRVYSSISRQHKSYNTSSRYHSLTPITLYFAATYRIWRNSTVEFLRIHILLGAVPDIL